MADYIVRALAADGQVRIFASTNRETVEEARENHNTSPVATAALGRLLTAGALMGVMMKGDKDVLTLQVKGDGPIGGITVTGNSRGDVKGYVNDPNVLVPVTSAGKLDVGTAVGSGYINVIKDMGLKEPYVGQTELQTGEIAEDLTFYFASSEQIPSAVGLGVLMEKNNTVKQAGGFILQLMPFAEESVISALEETIKELPTVTEMLEEGYTPEKIIEKLSSGMDFEILDTISTHYNCDCSRDKVTKALISIGKEETEKIIAEGKPVEVNCQFCNKNYIYEIDELKELIK